MFKFIFGLLFSGLGVWGITDTINDPDVGAGETVICVFFLFVLLGQFLVYKALENHLRYFIAEIILLVVFAVTMALWGRDQYFVEKAAISVCNGKSVPNTALYSTSNETHPIYILRLKRSQINRGDYPSGWLPKTVGELQLVACIDDEHKKIETCKYQALSKDRIQDYMQVKVIAAQTGQEVSSFQLDGQEPRACELIETFYSDRDNNIYGYEVPTQELINRLSSLVAP